MGKKADERSRRDGSRAPILVNETWSSHFDRNRLSSSFFDDGLLLTTATDESSFLTIYFVVIVTFPFMLRVSVRSIPLILGLQNQPSSLSSEVAPGASPNLQSIDHVRNRPKLVDYPRRQRRETTNRDYHLRYPFVGYRVNPSSARP
jgi:hypothetical protein